MKTVIEFYTESDGTQPVGVFLNQLKRQGESDPDQKQLYKLVLRGLLYLQQYGIAHTLNQLSQLEREDGTPYTIQLVKELKGFNPLLEFRINWRFDDPHVPGAARILFVEFQRGDTSYLALIQGMVKIETQDPAFKQQRDLAFRKLPSFFRNPGQFITLPQEEE